MIRTSESTAAIFAALAKAQATMPSAAKDATGQVGQQRTKYADLPSVREAARGPLTENDLAFVQFPSSAPPGYVRIITRILHKSGEWIEDEDGFTVPAGTTAQAVGSATTYAKRYSLQAALGIVADDDDDGKAASDAQTRQSAPRAPRTPTTRPQGTAREVAAASTGDKLSDAQRRLLMVMFGDHQLRKADDQHSYMTGLLGRQIDSANDLTPAEASKVIDALKATA